MKRFLQLLFPLLWVAPAYAKVVFPQPPFKIAIIDSGYAPALGKRSLKLCKTGHYDYMTETSNLAYHGPHGQRIAEIIAEKLKDVDYCAVIYQVEVGGGYIPEANIAEALDRALGEGIVAINLSMQVVGKAPDQCLVNTIKKLSEAHAPPTIFVAVGNESKNLDYKCDTYPACSKYRNIIRVGALDYNLPRTRAQYSNYGKVVQIWAPGYFFDNDEEMVEGTSYAAPRALSEFILFLDHKHRAK